MTFAATTQARIAIRATFECRNAAGEVIKTIEVDGSVPLSELGLSDAQSTSNPNEEPHGPHDRK